MERPHLGCSAVWLALASLLVASSALAGGLSFVEFQKETLPPTLGLRGTIDVTVYGDNVYALGNQDDAISVWTRDSMTNALTFLEKQEQGVGGVDGMRNPNAVAVTIDGKCLYVATEDNPPGPTGSGAVVVFNRAFAGTLTYLETQHEDVGGVDGIGGASSIAISIDDKHVYVGGEGDNAIALFSRTAPACGLTFVGFVQDGVGGVQAMHRPRALAISQDGTSVYAAAHVDVNNVPIGTVVAFTRNPTTGALTYLEHARDGVAGVDHLVAPLSAVVVSGNGKNVYVTSRDGDAVVAFDRDTGTGALSFLEAEHRGGLVKGIKGASGIALAPLDDYVYVTGHGDDAIAVFKRDVTTGKLDFLEFHDDPVPGTNVLGSAEAVAVVDDFSGGVYVAGFGPDTLVVFTADRCGDGHLGVDEQCDDGCLASVPGLCEPADDGDGCSSTCRLELCGPTPSGTCHAATPLGGAILQIKDQSDDRKDQLKWNWKGQATPLAQFGDPVTTASYVICVYDGSANPQPLMSLAAPAGGTCAGKPCWVAKPTNYLYSDKQLTPDGLKKVNLKEGLTDGKPKVQVQGFGIFVDPPTLPLTLPITVQVKNTQNTECWQAVYGTATKNDAAQFKAKSD